MPNVGIWEILLLVIVLLIVFGPKRLPEMGRSLGRGLREFKSSVESPQPGEEDEVEPGQVVLAEGTAPAGEVASPAGALPDAAPERTAPERTP